VTVLVGANRVPRGQSGDIRGKQVLTGNRHAHLENAAEKYGIRTLRTGAVDRRDLNTHIVDDRFSLEAPGGALKRYIGSSHPCPSFNASGREQRPFAEHTVGRKPIIIRQCRRGAQRRRCRGSRRIFLETRLPRGKTAPCCGTYYIVMRAILESEFS